MKKSFVVLGVMLAALCAILGLAACGGDHVHEWNEWETVTAPTCAAEGQEQRACKSCDEVETRAIQKLPHTEMEVEAVEATCLADGHEAGTECAVCGTALSGLQKIEALGHDYGPVVHVKTPTCTDKGLDRKTCKRPNCGAVEDIELEMTEHTIEPFGDNKDATCTEPGSKAGTRCTECQHVIEPEQTIEPLGHQIETPIHYDNGGVNYHRGTCTRPGCDHTAVDEPCDFTVIKTAATCTKAEHHVHTCPTCQYQYEHDEGSPLGHNFGDWHFDVKTYDMSLRDRDGAETVIRQHIRTCSNPGHEADPEYPEVEACTEEQDGEPVAATCIMSGYTNYKCTTCENKYTGDRVNALGHDWEKNEDGSVKYTHETYQGMEVHYRTCTRENCDRPNGKDTYYACYYTSSTREKATCTKGATIIRICENCKYRAEEEIGEPLGHAYGAWTHDDDTSGETSKHYRVCGREECGNREEGDCKDSMKSSGTLPTCQYEGVDIQVCEKCRYTQNLGALPKLQHDVTGQPYIADRAQKSHYQECKRCNEKVYEACPYTTSVKAMTCTTDEETTYTCPTCEDSYTQTTAPAAGHRVTNYTESNQFYHTGNCDECEQRVSVAHDFSESNICKVCHKDGLSYAFETGSNNTRARVVRTIKDDAYYYINTRKLVIPATVNIDGNGNVPVVGIASDAFFGNRYIEEVELPLSLEYIGYHAFQGCSNLTTVYFKGHQPGASEVADCKLNRIENGAFKDCTSLTNAILPATLQYIGQEAFRGCTQLARIDIPEKVTEIEDHAFTDTAYFLASEHWGEDGVLYIGKHLIRAREGLSGTYKVNDNVVSISAEAFMDCIYLEKIELPATLKAVDRDAFKGCTALTTVVFNGTFDEYLGIRFDNNEASPMHIATELTIAGESGTPTIPEAATVIPAGAFRGSDIESIVIPAGVTSIGAGAFADCEKLTSIKFAAGSKIISIGADVVKNTPFYNTAGNWENGVLYIKDEDGNPVALVAAKETELADYVKLANETELADTFKQVVIAQGTRVVAPEAFKGFTQLRYVEVADTVIFFGEHVFEGCSGPARVNFRGKGMSWFCYSAVLGRVYTDASVYGGAENEAVAKQEYAANLFNTYTLQWKRGNYGSSN